MKQLYLDLFSGMSGDMFIGALLDLGVDRHAFESELAKLGLNEFHLHYARGQKHGITGVKFDVHLSHAHDPTHSHPHSHKHTHTHEHGHTHEHSTAEDDVLDLAHEHGGERAHAHEDSHEHEHAHAHEHVDEHPHDHSHASHEAHGHSHSTHEHDHEHGRSFRDIQALIQNSALSPWVKDKAIAVFRRIAVAEGKIHGLPPEEVAFHEVGAVDSIVDIVGACIALELLGKPRVIASGVTEGTGWVDCAHGRFPIPAPATLEILGARGVPVSQCEEPHELLTPTGAALLAELAESFGPMQALIAEKVGFGLGTRDNRTRPNVLRAVLAASAPAEANDWETDSVVLLETNLDDVSPEVLGHFIEQALAAGALDAWHTPVQMKKNRPGVLLSVLCAQETADKLAALMLTETSAFGVRRQSLERRKLRRSFVEAETAFGKIPVKVGWLNRSLVQAAPEFEACRKAAASHHVPLKQVYAAALQAFHAQPPTSL